MHLEHWANAQNQAMFAAKNMLGKNEVYADVPWFWSDQYDINMQLVGHPHNWDKVVFRGDVGERRFSAFYLRDGRLLGTLTVNNPRDIRHSRELVRTKAPIDVAKLQDPGEDLKKMIPSA